jgi:hypothetical protein
MNSRLPDGQIVLVVPFALGHPSNFAARQLAPRLSMNGGKRRGEVEDESRLCSAAAKVKRIEAWH